MANTSSLKRAFQRDTLGNVSMVFASVAIPLSVAIGGAIDYGTAVSIKAKMQNALDAATTAVCADSTRDPESTIRARLTQSIAEFGLGLMLPPEEGDDPQVPAGNQAIVLNTDFDQTTGTVTPSLKTNMPTTFLNLAGIDQLPIEATAQISCGAKELELSLMLDVTGSMGGRKLRDMKTAANDVFDIFERNMEEGSTRIALVPFSVSVNVGDDLKEAIRGANLGNIRKAYYRWGRRRYRTYRPTSCVVERFGAEAFTDTPPGPGKYYSTYYMTSSSCTPSAELQPLTNDIANLRAEVAGYQASGGTAGHLGTSWAWNVISPKWSGIWPAESTPAPNNPSKLIKATILMTDGSYNTQYCHTKATARCGNSPNGNSFTQAQRLCTNMKTDGVVVYAVGFGINPNSYAAQKLKACATDETKWFFPYNGEQLRAAFQSIGRSLAAGQSGQPIIKR